MYKNPELSAQAKRLREELKNTGAELTHAQAMEMLAKVHGSRTLHVAQARKSRQGVDISELALRQTADLVFKSLGRYEGNVLGLVESIKVAFMPEESEGSRAVEAALNEIFGQQDSPVLSDIFERLMPSELPEYFKQTRQRVLKTLEQQFEPPAKPNEHQQVLYVGPALDWRVDEGFSLAELPEHHRTAYEFSLKRSGSQVYADVSVPHRDPTGVEGTPQLAVTLEVNHGRPCVHITNDLYGDMLLTVLATKDGLLVRPEEGALRTGVNDDDNELRKLQDELDEPFKVPGAYWFVPNKV